MDWVDAANKEQRRIVQITTGTWCNDIDEASHYTIIALCNDGTLWKFWNNQWSKVIDIPSNHE